MTFVEGSLFVLIRFVDHIDCLRLITGISLNSLWPQSKGYAPVESCRHLGIIGGAHTAGKYAAGRQFLYYNGLYELCLQFNGMLTLSFNCQKPAFRYAGLYSQR